MSEAPVKDLKAPDALAAAIQPINEESLESPSDGDASENGIEKSDFHRMERNSAESHNVQKAGDFGRLRVTRSRATDASVASGAPSSVLPPASKPWYKQKNPLRWGSIPPVPRERTVSREHRAGLLSKLTFQWMTPLMTVCAA